jgi:capsular polysaccharide biosynthesis protein
LFVGLFVAVVLVGAFDPRVRDERDVLRIGLLPLGSVPASGDGQAGAEV